MSIKNDITQRVIQLSSSYSSNKKFLEICDIKNHSLITDLKSGRINTPGAEILVKIVRGTGCSGQWLLTGEGPKFKSSRDKESENGRDLSERQVGYIKQLVSLLKSIDKAPDHIKKEIAGGELPIKFSEISTKLVKLQHDENNT